MGNVNTRAHTLAATLAVFACVLSDTCVCSAADRQAPSDTNHQAEEVLSPYLLSAPPSFHLCVTLRAVVSTLQGAIYPQVSQIHHTNRLYFSQNLIHTHTQKKRLSRHLRALLI